MNEARAHGQRVADALVSVIESARWDARIGSTRELARLSGMTHTSLNKRMDGTTVFNVRDLAAIGQALSIHPSELIRRAKAIADGDDPGATIHRFPTPDQSPDVDNVRRIADDDGGDIEDEQEGENHT